MRKLVLLMLAIAAAVGLVACGSNSASAALTGKNWQLTAITEKTPAFQGVIPAADQPRYVITFNTDGTFHGTADCNQFAGDYKTPGSNGLTITPGISTMAMCPDDSFGPLFVHGLARSKSFAIVNDVLTITLDDEGTMTFVIGVADGSTTAPSEAAASATAKPTAAPTAKPTASPTPKPTASPTPKPTAAPTAAPTTKPSAGATSKPTAAPTAAPTAKPTAAPTAAPTAPPATGLIGKTWQLTAITEKVPAFQASVPADQQANYTLTFAADSTFSAKADCNLVAGSFTTPNASAASGALTLTPGPTTTVMCPPGSYSDLYIIAITKSSSYAIASSQLTITLADGGTLVYK